MHLQVVGYFSRRLAFQAHQNPLDAQHDSWLLILLCLPSKFQQLGDGGPLPFSECWAHIPIIAHFADYVELFMRTYIVNGFPSTSDCYFLVLVNLRLLRFRT